MPQSWMLCVRAWAARCKATLLHLDSLSSFSRLLWHRRASAATEKNLIRPWPAHLECQRRVLATTWLVLQ